ncbi:MAG: hypothetical protein A2666_02660 [Parcubacteria group bacterium RIFCSPHIGHO2_01_FULL_47_10b]|nr:MAG: hypothetical protein A2666_02660 [Parcubacteria group bacterium RIFCSPHIGHO2_01_FULL_47_10b]
MKEWEEDLFERIQHAKTKDDHISSCAWLMHRFLWIHPFFDYNGRVSRLLGELYLLRSNLPVVDFQSTKRTDFVKAMKEATKSGDLSLLETLIS